MSRRAVRGALIERLRDGPLPSSEAESVTTRGALKVHIHNLRAAGFIIDALPDPAFPGPRRGLRPVVYHLRAEPSAEAGNER